MSPNTTPANQAEPELSADLIWGIAAIGEAIGRNPRQAYNLLENGKLPARLVGGRWVSSRSALRKHFSIQIGEVS